MVIRLFFYAFELVKILYCNRIVVTKITQSVKIVVFTTIYNKNTTDYESVALPTTPCRHI